MYLSRRRDEKLKESLQQTENEIYGAMTKQRTRQADEMQRHAAEMQRQAEKIEENKQLITQVGNMLTAATDTIEAFGKENIELKAMVNDQAGTIEKQGKMIDDLFDHVKDIEEYKLRDIDQALTTLDADAGALHDNVYGDLNDFKDDVLSRCARARE